MVLHSEQNLMVFFSDQIYEVEDRAIISMYEKEDAKKYLVA